MKLPSSRQSAMLANAILRLLGLLGISSAVQTLTENEAEDMANLTAVFVYLKNNCGYADMPNEQIHQAVLIFAQQNRWDLSNYAAYDMICARWAKTTTVTSAASPLPYHRRKMRIAGD